MVPVRRRRRPRLRGHALGDRPRATARADAPCVVGNWRTAGALNITGRCCARRATSAVRAARRLRTPSRPPSPPAHDAVMSISRARKRQECPQRPRPPTSSDRGRQPHRRRRRRSVDCAPSRCGRRPRRLRQHEGAVRRPAVGAHPVVAERLTTRSAAAPAAAPASIEQAGRSADNRVPPSCGARRRWPAGPAWPKARLRPANGGRALRRTVGGRPTSRHVPGRRVSERRPGRSPRRCSGAPSGPSWQARPQLRNAQSRPSAAAAPAQPRRRSRAVETEA